MALAQSAVFSIPVDGNWSVSAEAGVVGMIHARASRQACRIWMWRLRTTLAFDQQPRSQDLDNGQRRPCPRRTYRGAGE
jgi:hypothetical protein